VTNSLDAILEATRQVPGDQRASARHALAEAIGDEPAAHCVGVLDDQRGVCVRVADTLFFVRFDERGLAVTFLGSLRGGSLTETTQSRQATAGSVAEFDLRLRYEHLGRHLSIQTSHPGLGPRDRRSNERAQRVRARMGASRARVVAS
jgi:hypothetical protein